LRAFFRRNNNNIKLILYAYNKTKELIKKKFLMTKENFKNFSTLLKVIFNCLEKNSVCVHGKNDFVEVSKNLEVDTDLKIILLDQKIIM